MGERVIREISIQTGLDITFESTGLILESKLNNIIMIKVQSCSILSLFSDTRNLSGRVHHLLNDVVLKTLMLSADAASKVDDIHIQLSVLQRQCSYRDRPLCDTLKVKSFEEIGFIEKLKFVRYVYLSTKMSVNN